MKRGALCILAFVLTIVTLGFSACIQYDPSDQPDGTESAETTAQTGTTPSTEETTAGPDQTDPPESDGDGYPNEAEEGYTKRY